MATEQCTRCNKLIQASEAIECDVCDAIICKQCAAGTTCNIHQHKPICGVMFPRLNDVTDTSGCLKLSGHDNHHVCETKSGQLVAWHYDEECGCDDCIESDDATDACTVYWNVNNI